MSNFKSRLEELKVVQVTVSNPYAIEGAALAYETLKTAKSILLDLFPEKDFTIQEVVLLHDLLVKSETDICKAKITAQLSSLTKKDSGQALMDEMLNLTKKNPEGIS